MNDNKIVTESSKEILEKELIPVIFDEPVECFDGYIKSETFYGYIIGDMCFLKPKHTYPLIFSNSLKDRRNNSAEHVMKVEDLPDYIVRTDCNEITLVPCYYNGGSTTYYGDGRTVIVPDHKVWSYFRIVEKNFVYV